MGLADPSPHLIAAGQTDPGQRRALNEDAWRIADASHLGGVIEERGQLFAVADGMGGHAAGEVASELAIETLFAEYYASDDAPMSPAMRLEQAILTANARIYEQAGARASQAGMGTTIVAAVVHGEWLTIANVGDSRAYLVRDGTVQQLTRDHSWVAEQVTAGLLTEQQAQGHMYRNVVTRCLGHSAQIEVDTFEQVLQPSDVVLLCSDGLSNQVSEEELARVIAEQAPTEAVAELIELANRYGGPDNITAVLIVLQEEPSEAVTVVSAPRPEPQVAQTPPAKAAAPAAPSAKPAPARRSPSPLLKWGVPLVLVLSASCIVGIVLTVWGPEALWGWFITSTATPSVDGASATETPDETATATASATAAPSATWTATVPVTATPTHTVAPTSTATSTPTATSTSTVMPTATSTPLPTTTRQITG